MRSTAPLLALVALAMAASPASAAAPPIQNDVDSEHFLQPGGQDRVDCETRADETMRLTYSLGRGAVGAEGSYPGPWHDDGEVELSASVDQFGTRTVTSLRSTFTFESAAGKVTGTRRLAGAPDNGALVNCDAGIFAYLRASSTYVATIISEEGIFTDRGGSRLEIDQDTPGEPLVNYRSGWTSGLTTTEQSESALFGRRAPGDSFSRMSTNTKRASPFVLWFPANVRKVYAYLDGQGASMGSQTVRALLYRRDPADGGPGGYVTRSFEYTVTAGMTPRWIPLWLAPVPRLEPGVYWIGLQSGPAHAVARFAWNSKPASRRYNVDLFADGASTPFGAAFSDDQQMSLLAAGGY